MKTLLRVALVGYLLVSSYGWLANRAAVRQAAKYIVSVRAANADESHRLTAENTYLKSEVDRLRLVARTMLYNNEEIMAAARAGNAKKAIALRDAAVKSQEK